MNWCSVGVTEQSIAQRWPVRAERRFAAPLELLGHVFLDHVYEHVAITLFNLGKTFQIQLA